jgi:hypothetical protein
VTDRQADAAQGERFLFIHVMKTGGTSLAELVRANFPREACYPDCVLSPDSDLLQRVEAYSHVPALVARVNACGDSLRMVRGHVPYAVRELLDRHFVALSLLRHPVERTLSYLQHCRKYHVEHRDMAPEAIYEQVWFNASFIDNYQTRLFSMTAEEALAETRLGDRSPPLPPRASFAPGVRLPPPAQSLLDESPARFTLELFSPATGVLTPTAERLQRARHNLAQLELVGVTERYDAFLTALSRRHGWTIPFVPARNAGEGLAVSADFRRRIEDDNSFDMALYDTACTLAP